MKIITLDGYPASGKTEIRRELRKKYGVIMPERYYSYTEKALEKMWQDHKPDGEPPFLSNFFPLLTFARIHPGSRVAQANYASIEGFYILLHDLIHRTSWELSGEMSWVFENIIRLDFEFHAMTSYFIDVPLDICKSRRPDFPWGERDKWDEKFNQIWAWMQKRGLVQFIDGTQSIDDIVKQIGCEVKLV